MRSQHTVLTDDQLALLAAKKCTPADVEAVSRIEDPDTRSWVIGLIGSGLSPQAALAAAGVEVQSTHDQRAALTWEQLQMLELGMVPREDMDRLAAIEDPAARDRAVGMRLCGIPVDQTVREVEIKRVRSLTNEQWLAEFCVAVRSRIQDPSHYDRDALFYRHDRDNRVIHRAKAKPLLQEVSTNARSPLATLLQRSLFVCHPSDWLVCSECMGHNVDHPDCHGCHSCGYELRYAPLTPQKQAG